MNFKEELELVCKAFVIIGSGLICGSILGWATTILWEFLYRINPYN